jgi:hypothetical protein
VWGGKRKAGWKRKELRKWENMKEKKVACWNNNIRQTWMKHNLK